MKKKSKTSAWIRLITSSVLLLMLVLFLVMGITKRGFDLPIFSFGSSHYPNADRYTVGNTSISATELKDIEINWISGAVEIETYKGDTIEVSETCPNSLSEGDRVRSLYENGTLTIQFRESRFVPFGSYSGNKTLHIRIPETLAKNVRDLTLDSVSSDNTVSGLTVQNCKIDNVSGQIIVDGTVKDFDLDTVSGDCQLTSYVSPNSVNTDSVSGDFTLIIPDSANFTIQHDSVSGKINSDFSTTLSGDDEYTCGNGGTDNWDFDSVSGDVFIQKLKK